MRMISPGSCSPPRAALALPGEVILNEGNGSVRVSRQSTDGQTDRLSRFRSGQCKEETRWCSGSSSSRGCFFGGGKAKTFGVFLAGAVEKAA